MMQRALDQDLRRVSDSSQGVHRVSFTGIAPLLECEWSGRKLHLTIVAAHNLCREAATYCEVPLPANGRC